MPKYFALKFAVNKLSTTILKFVAKIRHLHVILMSICHKIENSELNLAARKFLLKLSVKK
jgi:hypothetical protein